MDETSLTPPFPVFFNRTTIYDPVNTPADICLNSTLVTTECDIFNLNGYIILSPELLPLCLLALYTGVTLAIETYKMKTKNSFFYAIAFAMTATMMTDAGWNDCLLPNLWVNNKFVHIYFAVIDVGLTSTIAYTFAILALLDADILKPNERKTYEIWGAGTALIFIGWIYTFVGNWDLGFAILYMLVVPIGCATWGVIQLHLIIKDRDWKSLRWFFFAMVHGYIGFYSLVSRRMQIWICENIDCHFSTNFIWFLVTSTALYFIFRYYKSRTQYQPKPKVENVFANNMVGGYHPPQTIDLPKYVIVHSNPAGYTHMK